MRYLSLRVTNTFQSTKRSFPNDDTPANLGSGRVCFIYTAWSRKAIFGGATSHSPESAAAYYELKRELAMRVKKEEYTEAKSAFTENILISCAWVQ
jgi:GrpB-like predicted nucleotidyltransferase (UPF0157 family)